MGTEVRGCGRVTIVKGVEVAFLGRRKTRGTWGWGAIVVSFRFRGVGQAIVLVRRVCRYLSARRFGLCGRRVGLGVLWLLCADHYCIWQRPENTCTEERNTIRRPREPSIPSVYLHLKTKRLNSAPNDRYRKSIEISQRKRGPVPRKAPCTNRSPSQEITHPRIIHKMQSTRCSTPTRHNYSPHLTSSSLPPSLNAPHKKHHKKRHYHRRRQPHQQKHHRLAPRHHHLPPPAAPPCFALTSIITITRSHVSQSATRYTNNTQPHTSHSPPPAAVAATASAAPSHPRGTAAGSQTHPVCLGRCSCGYIAAWDARCSGGSCPRSRGTRIGVGWC